MTVPLTLHFCAILRVLSLDMRLGPDIIIGHWGWKHLKVRGSRVCVIMYMWTIDRIDVVFNFVFFEFLFALVLLSSRRIRRRRWWTWKVVSSNGVLMVVIIWKPAAVLFVHSLSTSPRWSSLSPVHRLLSLNPLKEKFTIVLLHFSFRTWFARIICLRDQKSPEVENR